MALNSIQAFGESFDLNVMRKDNKLEITIAIKGLTITYSCLPGEEVEVQLPK